MADIDELIMKVTDPQLRAELAEQVAALVDRKQFGLVFQSHSPESVRLPKMPVVQGSKVQFREEEKGRKNLPVLTYRVLSDETGSEKVTIAQVTPSEEIIGDSIVASRDDLVVVKPFGEPVYPGLRQVGEVGTASPEQPVHVVINGENYHALQALEYTHADKVDLIYIDPPYNTGNSGWKYNDKYIDTNDSYRHSKWLSFMEKRLKIAKVLLKETGFIAISIDDSEQARLKMLADQVFDESNFVANMIWKSKAGGANDASLAVEHEYILVYRRSEKSVINKDKGAVATTSYSRSDPDGRKYSLERLDKQNLGYSASLDFQIVAPSGEIHSIRHANPAAPKARWRWSQESVLSRMDELVFEKGNVYTKNYEKIDGLTPRALLVDERFGRTRTGGTDLAKIFGDTRFTFPKPQQLIAHLCDIFAPSDAVIVDFFAGSGTSAEAVIRLNANDGGTRQSILVTNNELSKSEHSSLRKKGYRPGDIEYEAMGVFHHVTMPRIKTVLTGIREDGSRYSDGFDGQSAVFFDFTYENETLISWGKRFEAIAPMLWMQSGASGEIICKPSDVKNGGPGYSIPVEGRYAIIFDAHVASEAIASLHDGISSVFVVTDSDQQFHHIRNNLPYRLRKNAHRLYAGYLTSFKINHITR